ncbi:MAG: protease pro-enzyme activation domain-containing protein [Terriglobales bacterium]
MKSALIIMISIWLLATGVPAMAQLDRITASIDASQTVVLQGSVHAQARPEYDQGAVDPSLPLPYVVMVMKPSPAQQRELEQLLAQQQDSGSPNYHKWLTPEGYAGRFGLSRGDVNKISNWLRSQGFSIVQAARGRDWIAFSGTAGMVESTFHTQIHHYKLDGELHFANATEAAIPQALAGAVAGLRGLNDFRWKPMGIGRMSTPRTMLPAMRSMYISGNGDNLLAPDDIATIYDLMPLYTGGIDGTGMKMVVVGQVTVAMSDITAFRAAFNLPVNNPTVTVVPGTTPGANPNDLLESDLDLEWAGAVARKANVIFVTSDDVFTSAFFAIDDDIAPVISMSYGGCEKVNGAAIAATEPIMQQANAQGITFFSSSGDSGPASCDSPGVVAASGGLSVSYPASSPEITGVGGTAFDGDVPDPTPYWNTSNGPNLGTAISYIPETTWQESSSIASTGGGKSSCRNANCSGGFPKPVWQVGAGVPADNVRDVPDVSLNAAPNHDGYLLCTGGACGPGNFTVVGGTSASAPVFAGIVTLLNQQLGNLPPAGLGNINPTLYKLAQTPANNVFHDTTTGDNIIPCAPTTPDCPKTAPFQYGYSAGAGYDRVTGLGSIDVNNLFSNWNTGKVATTTALGEAPGTINAGSTANVTLTATVSPNSGGGTPTGSVGFRVDSTGIGGAALSGGVATFNYNPHLLTGGTHNFTASYGGDVNFVNSTSAQAPITVQDFTDALPANPTTVTVSAPGQSGTTTLTITPEFGFAQAVSFGCSGLPAEATCSASSVTPNGAPIMTTLTITTQASSAQLHARPGRGLFYALLLPGLLGMLLLHGKSGPGKQHFMGGMVVLICLTLWLPACGGGSSTPVTPADPGTPAGSKTVTVVATGNGGAPTHSVTLTLTVK